MMQLSARGGIRQLGLIAVCAIGAVACSPSPPDMHVLGGRTKDASDAADAPEPCTDCDVDAGAPVDPAWYKGAFRHVPLSTEPACETGCAAGPEQDLAVAIAKQTLREDGYAVPDDAELDRVRAMINAITVAMSASRASAQGGDWCAAIASAKSAG